MSTVATSHSPEADEERDAAVDVLDLEAAGTLGFLLEQQRREDRAAADKMRAVCHWADLHRVSFVGAVLPELAADIARRGAGVEDGVLGLERELRLAGEGAFTVSEFAVCELATALCMSEPAARSYVGQCLELRDRLPRLWDRVMAGALPAWKGRQVAEQTIPLSAAVAAYVDAQLAPFAHKVSLWRISRVVDAALLRHDPAEAAARAARAAEGRGVWVEDRVDGTSEIHAVTSTPDAAAFDKALDTVAATLGTLGDPGSAQVRRAKAVGVLADPQYALDLAAADSGHPAARSTGPQLSVHVHIDALAGVDRGAAASEGVEGVNAWTPHGVARADGYGPRAVDAVRRWLCDLSPGWTVRVTPVVDLTERIAVDAYEIPDRLRRQVEQRDGCCMFPWCGRRGLHDLDHIEPYVPPDDGGPPQQTSSENLARLCRFHHRVKTHGLWRYARSPVGTLLWTSPLGRTYAVDETGTLPQP